MQLLPAAPAALGGEMRRREKARSLRNVTRWERLAAGGGGRLAVSLCTHAAAARGAGFKSSSSEDWEDVPAGDAEYSAVSLVAASHLV
ncbi:hypothetical protein E4U53_004532 [Claviceps sorghi]|nr:hypothetical protein E4U53_004532 [Claviceps sorghi]